MTRRTLAYVVLAAAALVWPGCTMKDQEAPPLAGPSELGLSIGVSISPDVLQQDGASQSVVTITARGPNGEPLSNVTLRAEINVNGMAVDYGTLSSRTVVTGSDGRATLLYTAPGGSSGVDEFTIVYIVVTPIGTDYGNARARSASLRLVPPGVVLPPNALVPAFTFAPTSPTEDEGVLFDASTSQPAGGIASYRWTFGDGRSASGVTATNAYSRAGTYIVTLEISDSYGRTAATSQAITVGVGADPTASFVFSPEEPSAGQTVFFNASASKPSPGSTISSYSWDFGDGGKGTGVQPSHTFASPGTYNVTLLVTDGAGRSASTTQAVEVQ